MRRMLLVARHEYVSNVMRRAFLFATIGIPLLTIGLMVVVTAVTVQFAVSNDIGPVGFVDQSGLFTGADTSDTPFLEFSSQDAVEAAFDAGEVGAYFVIPPDYLAAGTLNVITRSGLPEGLKDELDQFLAAWLSEGQDEQTIARLLAPVELEVHLQDSNRTIGGDASITLFMLPVVFTMIFIIALQTAGSYLMSGVVEEKSNRIMEVLITSITPTDLLRGKILGLGLLALTQIAIWVAAAVITLQAGQGLAALSGVTLPLDYLLLAFVYFVLDFFVLAAIMAAIGAVVGSEQESRQISGLFSLVLVIPIFFLVSFITEPNGPIAVFLTLFPFTAPVAVILRMGMTSVPPVQIIASLVILTLTALGTAWISGRIFGWSLLLYGKRPGLRTLMRAVRQAEPMGTSATEGVQL
ncbi:MAG TPA: ABC transporter permease [Candidatus Limnocylindrales bacterium]|nr:ABC transporter permease [Candidatus Limnocylindrales bacterium]